MDDLLGGQLTRRSLLAGAAAVLAVAATPSGARATTTSNAPVQFNGAAVVAAARSLVGLSYALPPGSEAVGFGHNSTAAGPTLSSSRDGVVDWTNGALDCSGFVRAAYWKAGIDLGSGGTNRQVENFDQINLFGQLSAPEFAVPGDVLYFGHPTTENVEYVDIYGTGWDIVHTGIYAGGSTASSRGYMYDSDPSVQLSNNGVQYRRIFNNPALIGYFHVKNDVNGSPVAQPPTQFDEEDDVARLMLHPNGTVALIGPGPRMEVLRSPTEMDALRATGQVTGDLIRLSDSLIWDTCVNIATRAGTYTA